MKVNPATGFIYAKEVARITGFAERRARRLLEGIGKKLGKKGSRFVTVQNFCQHTGLRLEDVIQQLHDCRADGNTGPAKPLQYQALGNPGKSAKLLDGNKPLSTLTQ